MSEYEHSYGPCEEFLLESLPLQGGMLEEEGVEGSTNTSTPFNPLPTHPTSASDVVEFTISAKDSFEVFMGKRYDPSQFAWGLGSNAQLYTQDSVVPSHPSFDTLAAHLTERLRARGVGRERERGGVGGPHPPPNAILLSPLDRFTRLLAGLQALQAELGEVGGGEGEGGVFKVLTEGVQVAQERLGALKPAAEAAHAAGVGSVLVDGGGGGAPIARPTPPDASVFKALALEAAQVAEAQAAAEAATAKATAMANGLHKKLLGLYRSTA